MYKGSSTIAQKFSELQMLKQKVVQPYLVSPYRTEMMVRESLFRSELHSVDPELFNLDGNFGVGL